MPAHVGRRIRIARQRHHLTQRALAKKLGVSYQLVQQYEQGRRLTVERAHALADTLKVSPEWLLAGVGCGTFPR